MLPIAEHEYTYRYVIPAVPLACMAAALAFRDRSQEAPDHLAAAGPTAADATAAPVPAPSPAAPSPPAGTPAGTEPAGA